MPTKVTLATILAMAKAAGIQLPTDPVPTLTRINQSAFDAKAEESRQLLAALNAERSTITHLRLDLAGLQDELLQSRADRHVLEETLKARLPEASHTEERARVESLERELVEARSENDALHRTVAKLRPSAVAAPSAAPQHDPEGCDRCGKRAELFHDEETGAALCTRCSDIVAEQAKQQAARTLVNTPAAPALLNVQFIGPQGVGTSDRLKALGARWRFTSAKGEKVKGFWIMPDVPAVRALLDTLKSEGKAIVLV